MIYSYTDKQRYEGEFIWLLPVGWISVIYAPLSRKNLDEPVAVAGLGIRARKMTFSHD